MYNFLGTFWRSHSSLQSNFVLSGKMLIYKLDQQDDDSKSMQSLRSHKAELKPKLKLAELTPSPKPIEINVRIYIIRVSYHLGFELNRQSFCLDFLAKIDLNLWQYRCPHISAQALDLHPVDLNGLADPYLHVQLGRRIRNDKDNRQHNTLQPVFGKWVCWHFAKHRSSSLQNFKQKLLFFHLPCNGSWVSAWMSQSSIILWCSNI